jgi:hypothetical protein
MSLKLRAAAVIVMPTAHRVANRSPALRVPILSTRMPPMRTMMKLGIE